MVTVDFVVALCVLAMEIIQIIVPSIIKAGLSFISYLWDLKNHLLHVTHATVTPDISSLIQLCKCSTNYLKSLLQSATTSRLKFLKGNIDALNGLLEALTTMQPMLAEIREISPNYDFPGAPPGNGYRSFVSIADKSIVTCYQTLGNIEKRINDLDLSLTEDIKEVANFFTSLAQCFECLIRMKSLSKEDSLYAFDGISIDEMIDIVQSINKECFYGKFFAVAFEERIRMFLKFLSFGMVSYSELYYGPLKRLLRPPIYAFNDSARARRHVVLANHAGVDFIQKFWGLSESTVWLMPSRIANPIAVCEDLVFDKSDVIVDGVKIERNFQGVVKGKLISKHLRLGMARSVASSKSKSRGLIVHVHGGGFISQSSNGQEVYLRKWAASLDVPIFSIDYSLAPEYNFPHQIYEVFFAYCVALANAASLGSTAERVVMVGDSAGANLILAAVLECFRTGMRRPDGLFLAYVPVLVNFVPSPARLLGLMDPFLPFGLLMRCAQAYIKGEGAKSCLSSNRGKLCLVCCGSVTHPKLECMRKPFLVSVPDDPYLSPYQTTDAVICNMPPVRLLTSTLDPCLDDTVMFAKKLRRLGRDVSLDIVDGLPHGFLNLCGVNEKAADAVRSSGDRISSLLDLP